MRINLLHALTSLYET